MICLDTNAVIAILNNRQSTLRDRFSIEQARGGPIAVSTIVVFELLYGAAKSSKRQASDALVRGFITGPISTLNFDSEDAEEAGDIRATLTRAGTPIGPYDILIAAQARRRDALLVTANTREFARVPRLKIEDWTLP